MTYLKATAAAALVAVAPVLADAATYNVLWWDSTPDYGGQAPDSQRKEMADYLETFDGGITFDSTYVSSETPGTLATHLSSNSYDVIVFDATSSTQKFDAADLAAVQTHYGSGKKNLMLDGTLYIRSISFDSGSDFPGANTSSGGLTVNQVFALADAGGGIMVGTDHNGFQADANQIVEAVLPGASFSGITSPSTDGVFYGGLLLNGPQPIAAVDVFNHWDTISSQAVAATGAFTDILGNTITLSSLVDVADDPGGGPKFSYISTSLNPGDGTTDVDDDTVGGGGGGGGDVAYIPLPLPAAMLLTGLLGLGAIGARRRT